MDKTISKKYDRILDSACDQIVEAMYQVEDYEAELDVIDQSIDALSDKAFVEKNRDSILRDYAAIAVEYEKRIARTEKEISAIEEEMHDYRAQDGTQDTEEEEIRGKRKLIRNGMMGGLIIGIALLVIAVIVQCVQHQLMAVLTGNIILWTLIFEGVCYLQYTRTFEKMKIAEKRGVQSREADEKWKNQLRNEKNQLALYKSKAALGSLQDIDEIREALEQQKKDVQGYIEYNRDVQEKCKQKIRSIIELNPDTEGYIHNLLKTYEDKFTI